MTTRELIDDFLSQKRIAMVGVSRNPRDFSQVLLRDLKKMGYDIVPVNPNAAEIDGLPCYPRLQDIEPGVDGALLITTPAVTEQVVRDCTEAGIERVWMQRGVGTGSVSRTAVDFCDENGLRLIPGFCPYMFLPDAALFHRIHGFFLKLTGKYPK